MPYPIMNKMYYVSIDGDDVGKKLTELLYTSGNEKDVSKFSNLVIQVFESMKKWVEENRGTVLFCAGDSILYKIPKNLIKKSLQSFDTNLFTITVGIGNTMVKAHWALNIAKSLGKDRILFFEEIEKELF